MRDRATYHTLIRMPCAAPQILQSRAATRDRVSHSGLPRVPVSLANVTVNHRMVLSWTVAHLRIARNSCRTTYVPVSQTIRLLVAEHCRDAWSQGFSRHPATGAGIHERPQYKSRSSVFMVILRGPTLHISGAVRNTRRTYEKTRLAAPSAWVR
jgi:hypothetical protein